jgi:hypothetical protein
MKKWIALGVLLLPIALAGCVSRSVVVYSAPPPPAAYSEAARQGFNDGVAAAQRDLAQARPPSADRHPRFRNPPVPPPLIEDYRHGFGEGYNQVIRQGGPRY